MFKMKNLFLLMVFLLFIFAVPAFADNTIEKLIESAESGEVKAQYKLGDMYYNGEGVSKDNNKAFKWYEKAALQGDADAQYELGSMYSSGAGVPKDPKKAFEWHEKAALQGNQYSQSTIGDMYCSGVGVSKDYKKAFEWHEKAALQGNPLSQFITGKSYYYVKDSPGVPGIPGITQDYKKAYAYFNLSAKTQIAEDFKNEISKKMSKTDILEAQELSNKILEQIKKNKKK